MNYPDTVKTNSDKLAFCYAAQEKLRQMHNEAVMKDAVLVASVDLDKTLSAATAEK